MNWGLFCCKIMPKSGRRHYSYWKLIKIFFSFNLALRLVCYFCCTTQKLDFAEKKCCTMSISILIFWVKCDQQFYSCITIKHPVNLTYSSFIVFSRFLLLFLLNSWFYYYYFFHLLLDCIFSKLTTRNRVAEN